MDGWREILGRWSTGGDAEARWSGHGGIRGRQGGYWVAKELDTRGDGELAAGGNGGREHLGRRTVFGG